MKDKIGLAVYFQEHAPPEFRNILLRRSINALVRGGFETMDDLVAASPETLARVRNLGAKSLALVYLLREQYMAKKTS